MPQATQTQQHMGRFPRIVGNLADFLIPGDAFDQSQPSFGQGWRQGDYSRVVVDHDRGAAASLAFDLGTAAVPGGLLAHLALSKLKPWLFNKFGGSGANSAMPELSKYGPYADGYQGLQQQASPQSFQEWLAGYGDAATPEFSVADVNNPYNEIAAAGLNGGHGSGGRTTGSGNVMTGGFGGSSNAGTTWNFGGGAQLFGGWGGAAGSASMDNPYNLLAG